MTHDDPYWKLEADGNDLLANPDREPVYSSSAIHERRKRILIETRRMIADVGIDGFSVRTLCKNADVAQRTLYNAFHSKDRLIAIAIKEAYEQVNRHIHYRTSAETIEGIVDRLISVNSRNLKARNYTKAVASLYFSPSIGRDIWDALRDMAFLNLQRWLDQLEQDGNLQEWAVKSRVAADLANLEYSIINDWSLGRLSDEEYLPRLIFAVLSHAAGVTRGQAQADAIEMMRFMKENGRLPKLPNPAFRPDPAPES